MKPTQTPRTDAIWKTRTLRDRTDDNAYLESVSLERDLALSAQRIAELGSANSELLARLEKRVQDFNVTDKARLDEIRRLQARGSLLEQAMKLVLHNMNGLNGPVRGQLCQIMNDALEGRTNPALSPPHPAVEATLNSDSFKCPKCAWIGSRDQLKSVRGVGNCPQCWLMRAEAIIPIKHPSTNTVP